MFSLAFSSELFAGRQTAAQNSISMPDLTKLVKGKGWTVINRSASLIEGDVKKGIQFDERPEPGLAWLNGFEFANGVIEFDVKGRNVSQKSFVGVAFHGLDEKTYEAIYFRPFNFRSEDPVRRTHAVQYISHPTYTCQKLRNEHPGKYEQAISPAPDRDVWFHARVFVLSPNVSVFVNGAREPSLVVEQLSARKKGWVGFRVGENSPGAFANLKITRITRFLM